jgi:hypothetical protein
LFTKEDIINGWSMFWRTFPIFFLFFLIAQINMDGGRGFLIPERLQPLQYGICAVICLFLFDFLGKKISKTKYNFAITDFIGWDILWRFVVMDLYFVVMFYIVILAVAGTIAEAVKADPNIIRGFPPITLVNVISAILALGWTTTTVIKNRIENNPLRRLPVIQGLCLADFLVGAITLYIARQLLGLPWFDYRFLFLAGILLIIRSILTVFRLRLAWFLHVIFSWVTGIVFSFIVLRLSDALGLFIRSGFFIIMIALSVFIVVYFTRPRVKGYFIR